jgi:hypothetical protein
MFVDVLKIVGKDGRYTIEPEMFPIGDIKSSRSWHPSEDHIKCGIRVATKIFFKPTEEGKPGGVMLICEKYESFSQRIGSIPINKEEQEERTA